MTREELFSDISAAALEPGDVLYIERRGEAYAWKHIRLGANMEVPGPGSENQPDVWIFHASQWPFGSESPERCFAFFADLLDEMESMANKVDRCRWPFDKPWPHRH